MEFSQFAAGGQFSSNPYGLREGEVSSGVIFDIDFEISSSFLYSLLSSHYITLANPYDRPFLVFDLCHSLIRCEIDNKYGCNF